MKQNIKNIIFGFVFINILFFILLLVNLIPSSVISNNIKNESFIKTPGALRENFIEDKEYSKCDYIADEISLNIMYNIDSKNILKSTLLASYYDNGSSFYSSYRDTLYNGMSVNTEYSRYWHGYMILFRPLLIICSVLQIEILFFIIYILLNLLIVIYCIKNKYYHLLLSLIGGTIIAKPYFGFVSLEYMCAIIISYLFSYLVLKINKNYSLLFLLSGISVCFFDFLTAETLTLTFPLICLISKYFYKNKEIKIKTVIKYCIYWLFGYGFSFLYKWILTFVFIGKKYLQNTIGKALVRIDVTGKFSITDALKLNINMLFSKESNNNIIFFIIILIACCIIFYLFRKDNFSKNNVLILLVIFFIPYARYIVLTNHSIIHFFFTYRAQMSSIMSILLILLFSIDFKMLKRRK